MNKETAEKLYKAKFPNFSVDPYTKYDIEGILRTVPNLGRIIEAMGKRFGKLEHVIIRESGIDAECWMAYSSRIQNELNVPAYIVQKGETPEEAVTNLYCQIMK